MTQVSTSIILPAYNRARFIGQTIESVIHQTDQDWELIIIDDGSTDDTHDVVANYRDPRIRYVKQANAGASMARNTGISLAVGKWIACIDSDDEMLPHNLQSLRAVMEAQPASGCTYGWFYLMDESGAPISHVHGHISGHIPPQLDHPWPGRTPDMSGTSGEGQILPELVSTTDGTIVMGAFLVRREWVERIGGFNPSRQHQEHWDFFIRLARAGCPFSCCRQAVLLLRDHVTGAHRDYDQMFAARLDVLDQIYRDSGSDAKLRALIEPVHDQAYRTTFIDAAKGAYSSGQFVNATQHLNFASQYAPLNDHEIQDMIERSVKWLVDHPCGDENSVLHNGFALMDDPSLARKASHQAIALYDFNLACRAHAEGHSRKALIHSLKAIAYDPRHVMNRGLLKVMVSSLIS